MWPERGHPTVHVAVERGRQSLLRRRLAVVAERHLAETELVRARGEGRLEQRQHLETGRDELRAERRNALAPRLDRGTAGSADRRTPQRGVSLRHRRAVLGRQ